MFEFIQFTRNRLIILFTPVAAVLAFLSGWYITYFGFSYREVIVLGLFIGSLVVLSSEERSLKFGLLLAVAALGLGYRTIELTSRFRLHPAELLLWTAFLLLLYQRRNAQQKEAFWLPRWLWMLIPFWLLAWFIGLARGLAWDLMLAEFRNFLVLFPLFAVAQTILRGKKTWRALLLTFFLTGTWIAAVGVLEYVLPNLAELTPQFITQPGANQEIGGFLRARYSFWGAPSASFILVLTAPLIYSLWHRYPRPPLRLLMLAVFILQAYGAYIGGYRSIWLIMLVQMVVGIILSQGILIGSAVTFILVGSYQALSSSIWFRFNTLLLALEGNAVDSSAIQRIGRSTRALEIAFDQPWGVGWAGTGWTHNDLVQIAANQGLLAGIIFTGAYLFTLYRLWQTLRINGRDKIRYSTASALFLSYIAAGGILVSQGVQVLPQTVIPVWLIWVVVEIWIYQTRSPKQASI